MIRGVGLQHELRNASFVGEYLVGHDDDDKNACSLSEAGTQISHVQGFVECALLVD